MNVTCDTSKKERSFTAAELISLANMFQFEAMRDDWVENVMQWYTPWLDMPPEVRGLLNARRAWE